MTLEKREDWYEGYLNNVWCRFKTFLSADGDLFVVAKRDSTVRVFKISKKIVNEHEHEELNEVMKFAQEVSKIPDFIKKKI